MSPELPCWSMAMETLQHLCCFWKPSPHICRAEVQHRGTLWQAGGILTERGFMLAPISWPGSLLPAFSSGFQAGHASSSTRAALGGSGGIFLVSVSPGDPWLSTPLTGLCSASGRFNCCGASLTACCFGESSEFDTHALKIYIRVLIYTRRWD